MSSRSGRVSCQLEGARETEGRIRARDETGLHVQPAARRRSRPPERCSPVRATTGAERGLVLLIDLCRYAPHECARNRAAELRPPSDVDSEGLTHAALARPASMDR